MVYILITILLFIPIFGYFKIANHYNIIGHSNERSYHSRITIWEGAGIIFVLAGLAAVIMHTNYWLPMLGLLIIGVVSFADDRIMLACIVLSFFNSRKKTRCFAGDGADSVTTIIHRILLRQNVLKPHRLHLYQIMMNEQKLPHLNVAAGYVLLQAAIIYFIINSNLPSKAGLFVIILLPLVIIYILLKMIFMRNQAGNNIA